MKGDEFWSAFFGIVGFAAILAGIFVLPLLFVAALPFLGAYAWFRIYRDSPARKERVAREHTEALYRQALAQVGEPISDEDARYQLGRHLPGSTPESVEKELIDIGLEIFKLEGLDRRVPPPPAVCNSVEGGRYRDMLAKLSASASDPNMAKDALDIVAESIGEFAQHVPTEEGDVNVPAEHMIDDLGRAVLGTIMPFFRESDYGHFKSLKQQLDKNFNATAKRGQEPIWPDAYDKPDVVETYLRATPLERIFDIGIPFDIPESKRFEHQFILGGSGHGKTQCLQHYILKDVEEIDYGRKSVIVIDSQGDLINRIKRLEAVTEQNCVLIDPNDIEFPVALNLFDVQMDRLMQYPALAREKLINGILELYDFVLGSLLSAELTQKQTVIFRYVTRLMLYIPDATIHTLLDLFQPGGSERYRKYIAQLSGTAKTFFEHEFDSKEFEQTKKQVVRRLYGILENQTFERMFSNPRSKVDLFKEMNDGKIILIDTAKGLLKESGTQIFGRFFIAMITQAAQEREEISEHDRLPCHVYIDEASDYFDENIDIILSQARKYRVGMTMATQYLEQMSPKLQAGIAANTSIKFAGGASAKDARRMAAEMRCDPEFIVDQPKLTFAAFVRGLTPRAIPMRFSYGEMEAEPTKSREEMVSLRNAMRERYATRVAEPLRSEPTVDEHPEEPSQRRDEDTPSDAASSAL